MHSHPVYLRLLNEAAAVYIELHSALDALSEPDQVGVDRIRLKASEKYRAILQSCSEFVRHDPSGQNTVRDTFQKMELLWSLTEAVLLPSADGAPANTGLVSGRLWLWTQQHFTSASDLILEVLETRGEHPKFWEAMKCALLQIRISEAKQLLSLHPCYRTVAYQALDEMLVKLAAVKELYRVALRSEFEAKWLIVKKDFSARISTGVFDRYPVMETIAKLISGDEEALGLCSSEVSSWMELLAPLVFYTAPGTRAWGLQRIADKAVTIRPSQTTGDLCDFNAVMLAALQTDPWMLLRTSKRKLMQPWLTFHLGDLLLSMGPSPSEDNQKDLLGQLLLEFTTHLIDTPMSPCWQLALLYLDHGAERWLNTDTVEAEEDKILKAVSITSDKVACQVVAEARNRSLEKTAALICENRCRAALDRNQLEQALPWALRSGNRDLTSQMADRHLQSYALGKTFDSYDILQHVGPWMLVSERFTFLGKYQEFLSLRAAGKQKKALELLVSLIQSDLSPAHFCFKLLLDSVPMLEIPEAASSMDVSLAILEFLEKVKQGIHCGEVRVELSGECERRIRTACSRNLAQAIQLSSMAGGSLGLGVNADWNAAPVGRA